MYGDKLELKVFGFNEKIPALLSKILAIAKSFIPSLDRFKVCEICMYNYHTLYFHSALNFIFFVSVSSRSSLIREYLLHPTLQVIKENMERGLRNTNMKPLNHSTYLRLQLLCKRIYDSEEKLSVLNDLSLTDLNSFIPEVRSQVTFCISHS